MVRDALARLVEGARQLPKVTLDAATTDAATTEAALGHPEDAPLERGAVARVTLPRAADRRRKRGHHDAVEPAELKIRVRELLAELARRLDAELGATLERAHAWDQVDSLRILDRAVDEELAELQHAARLLKEDPAPARRALGTEAQLTLDAAIGLVSLVEKRLATLIRLRLRAGDDDSTAQLLPDGRPFLDIGAALHETARRWA